MKVLIINGSPDKNGTCTGAIEAMLPIFKEENIDVEVFQIGHLDIRGCIGCGACYQLGKCAFDDCVNEIAPKFEEADGIVVASPVHYASPSGAVMSFMDRLFYSSRFDKTMKVGASIACARRAGADTTFDVLNKYYTINGMPVVSSKYWNNVFGNASKESALQDEEGISIVKQLARNMSYLIKCISLGKEQFGPVTKEERKYTNFIR